MCSQMWMVKMLERGKRMISSLELAWLWIHLLSQWALCDLLLCTRCCPRAQRARYNDFTFFLYSKISPFVDIGNKSTDLHDLSVASTSVQEHSALLVKTRKSEVNGEQGSGRLYPEWWNPSKLKAHSDYIMKDFALIVEGFRLWDTTECYWREIEVVCLILKLWKGGRIYLLVHG